VTGAPACAAVGGIVHESSTFATGVTGLVTAADFTTVEGEQLLAGFAGTATVMGGYLAGAAQGGLDVMPTLHARAEPAGAVHPAVFAQLQRRLLDLLEAGRCQLVLLDMHGAGVVSPDDSLDLWLARAVRAAVGPSVLIAATLDLHGNVPVELADELDIVVGYQEYPHVDVAERAARAARIAAAGASGQLRPRTRVLRLPMVLPPAPTDGTGPGAELRDRVVAAEHRSGVLACTVFHGFPYADTPQAGATVVTVSDGDAGLADAVNNELAGWLWRERRRFLPDPLSPERAIGLAVAAPERPVVVGDAGDNPGGGGSGDGVHLLRALLASGRPACFATLHDPAAVAAAAAAGVGACVELTLGGWASPASGEPVRARATVHAVTDGRATQTSVHRGRIADFGRSARVSIGRLDLVISSKAVQVTDPAIFALHGIAPERYELVGVKSAIHFRSGFASIAGRLLTADSDGLTSRAIDRFARTGPSARLWPMHRAASFARAKDAAGRPAPASSGLPV